MQTNELQNVTMLPCWWIWIRFLERTAFMSKSTQIYKVLMNLGLEMSFVISEMRRRSRLMKRVVVSSSVAKKKEKEGKKTLQSTHIKLLLCFCSQWKIFKQTHLSVASTDINDCHGQCQNGATCKVSFRVCLQVLSFCCLHHLSSAPTAVNNECWAVHVWAVRPWQQGISFQTFKFPNIT